jgi:hypothetical protein
VRRLLIPATCCVLVASVGNAHAGVPTTQTCRGIGLGISFVMPSDWSCGCQPGAIVSGHNPVCGSEAPGNVAQLNVYARKTASTVDLSRSSPLIVASFRQDLARTGGSGVTVASSRTTVGSGTPALHVAGSYNGFWLQGAGQQGRIWHVQYYFSHGGLFYEFDYAGVTPWVTKYLRVFATSAKSIRFVTVA